MRTKAKPLKKIAVINDLSGYGHSSLAVSIPIISAFGIQAVPVPTAILSNHTGFASEYKYDFTDHMEPFVSALGQLRLSFDGIMTGYMNYEEQVRISADFIERFKKKGTVVLVDPAMADHGRLYRGFTGEYAGYVRDRLIRQATVIKPNITEACLITGFDYDEILRASKEHTQKRLKSYLMTIIDKLQSMGPADIVISGVERGDRIINAVSDKDEIRFISVKKAGEYRSGTGDIFSSIVISGLLLGMSLGKSVRKASDFVAAAIAISEEAGMAPVEGVMFERILSRLTAIADQSENRAR